VKQVLGEERAGVFADVYGVEQGGNCNLSSRSDPHQEFTGKNVLMQVSRFIMICIVNLSALPAAGTTARLDLQM
jgi:hypothetical protein